MHGLEKVADKMLEVMAENTPNEAYALKLYNLAIIIYENMTPEEKERVKELAEKIPGALFLDPLLSEESRKRMRRRLRIALAVLSVYYSRRPTGDKNTQQPS